MTRQNRKAVGYGVAGIVALIVLPAASLLTPAADMPAFACAGVVVFAFCGAKALRLCCADRIVFDDSQRRARYVSPGRADSSVIELFRRRALSKRS